MIENPHEEVQVRMVGRSRKEEVKINLQWRQISKQFQRPEIFTRMAIILLGGFQFLKPVTILAAIGGGRGRIKVVMCINLVLSAFEIERRNSRCKILAAGQCNEMGQ